MPGCSCVRVCVFVCVCVHLQSCQGLGGQMLEVWGAEAGDWGQMLEVEYKVLDLN